MVNPFIWKEENFSVGVKLIDDQHKRLFEIGSEIYQLANALDDADHYDDIVDLIDELEKYTVYHFDTEEAFFEKYDYHEAEEHIAEHKQFLQKIADIDLSQIDDNQRTFINEIIMFVFKWIIKHINGTDFKYIDFMKVHYKEV